MFYRGNWRGTTSGILPRLSRALLLIGLTLLLSGCAGRLKVAPPILVEAAPEQKIRLTRPDPMVLRELEWFVYSQKNIELLRKKVEDTALLCLVPRDYEDLGLNLADIVRYIQQLQAMIEGYEKLYVDEPDEDAGD